MAKPNFPSPSKCAFETIAKEDVRLLERWVLMGDLRPGYLSLAVETLGEVVGSAVVPSLLKMLHHSSPLVREATVRGLAHHASDEVIACLDEVAERDASVGVRATARRTARDLIEG